LSYVFALKNNIGLANADIITMLLITKD